MAKNLGPEFADLTEPGGDARDEPAPREER